MSWLKSVLIDILMFVVIAIYVFMGVEWGYWIIVIYTPLMLLLKIGALTSGIAQAVKQKSNAAPNWFFHALYGVIVIFFLVGNYWLLSGAWAAIWLLSAIQEARKTPKKSS